MSNFTNAQQLAKLSRVEILKMTHKANASHVGSALSVIDILAALYTGIANIGRNNVHDPERDIVILSKGHAASALYSVLALQGFFPIDWLNRYCEDNSELGGHVTSHSIPGIELSTGSLGHGLPYGVGVAISKKMTKVTGRVFIVISDGECDEGTTWESALFAAHHELSNVCVIIDRNRIQSLGSTESTMRLEPLQQKWNAFGWEARTIDGHNFDEITKCSAPTDKPLVLIAETIKGKGVDFMENSVAWHYKSPSQEELSNAVDQISKGESD